MSDQHIETCPDNHHCLNGSKCVQNPYDEGSYYCDCNEVIWDVRYEGLFCEHKESVYCGGLENGISEHWFCTNGGTCITEQRAGSGSAWGCDCPNDYEGTYCQFVRGSKPKGYPYTNNSISDTKQKGSSSPVAGAVVGSLVTILVIATIGAAVYYRRKLGYNRSSDGGVTGKDLELEMDGSSMKDVVSKSMQEAAHSPGANWSKNVSQEERPNTRQSEAGLSYADSEFDEDNSMLSLT
mmetsp:Transcript_7555/g.11526  ORF Transcript_7555/g.11526 Transcript_7555/m.11526 type:complete len:238 (+) Transcript_7555:102-815(+)|eukprot:CAMPEP_0203645510 /NCGR_PEP_ID=MMETSP0088-20131115/11229_1 /ASSEMBLY_ACC=CAM_ASM_001087 /TAXON_ID=426623 /ORGANISM="Chaetoceros affinis, Strain CCMP159" /LENGTH=237 /DNA_ID=CAMNT_0050502369 /DNA_START=1 /DNA_END=714 /DNA_ORIENTATION=+